MADDQTAGRLARLQSTVTRRDAPESGRGSERVTSDRPDALDWAEAHRQDMARRYEAAIVLWLWWLAEQVSGSSG